MLNLPFVQEFKQTQEDKISGSGNKVHPGQQNQIFFIADVHIA